MKSENKIFIITLLYACFANFMFSHDAAFKISILTLSIASGILIVITYLMMKKQSHLWPICPLTIGMLLCIRIIDNIKSMDGEIDVILGIFAVVTAVIALVSMLFILRRKSMTEDTILLILVMGMLLRLVYIVGNQAHIFQNDIGTLMAEDYGHLGYIYYIYANRRLPAMNPMDYAQFYHPPLHHIIAAIFVKINTLFGIGMAEMDEHLQMLPFIYSMFTLGYLNKIGKRLEMSAEGRCIGLLAATFFPLSIILSGGLNNDGLLLLLMVMSIYYTLCWYQEPSYKHIVCMAISIGCSMMTKLSGALLAPAMAVIMLLQFFRHREQWKCYVKQFSLFAVISFPLGLWFPIKNFIQYEVPLNYVPIIGTGEEQYIGMFSRGQRLFDFSGQLNSLCLQWSHLLPDVDHNIFTSILKFSTFGEGKFLYHNPAMQWVGTILFWMNTFIMLAMPVIFVLGCIRSKKKRIPLLFLGIAGGTVLLSYIQFCFSFPYICTMNTRYIMVTILIGLLCYGIPASFPDSKHTKVYSKVMVSFFGIYSILVITMFGNLMCIVI